VKLIKLLKNKFLTQFMLAIFLEKTHTQAFMKNQTSKSCSSGKSIYTITLTPQQAKTLKIWCEGQLWEPYSVEYAAFAFKGNKINLVQYNSGKLVIQGKGTEDFIKFTLEPNITQEMKFGYEEVHHPEWFSAHAGLDESGKGDFFGPVVCACVAVDEGVARTWIEMGIKDSKRITTDAEIFRFDELIRKTQGVVVKTTFAGMEKYNALYYKFGSNLNRLLAWQHATALSEVLQEKPVKWGMLDQFCEQPLVKKELKSYPDFDLRMSVRAESDPIVAAASIVARATFVRQMDKLSEQAGFKLLKGASAQVKEQGRNLVDKFGSESLGKFAKLHFRTAAEILGLPVPEKFVWKKKLKVDAT
jgi:ribonuclease HIII